MSQSLGYNSHEGEWYNEDEIIEHVGLIADDQQRELELKEAE
ncbi:MAG: hypothetical protein ACI9NT_002906 [Bacteroidia bacterium]